MDYSLLLSTSQEYKPAIVLVSATSKEQYLLNEILVLTQTLNCKDNIIKVFIEIIIIASIEAAIVERFNVHFSKMEK